MKSPFINWTSPPVSRESTMTNTLYLPEIREMLAENDADGLHEFCTALHPGRTAEFMEGLTAEESWSVLCHADLESRVEIYHYFDEDKQVAIIESIDRVEMAAFIGELAPDDRVDILKQVDTGIVAELMPLVPAEERRDIQRLTAYAEGTAGAVMTTEFARVSEHLVVKEAMEQIAKIASQLETVYYLYVVDEEDHLRGVVSARQWLSAMGRPETLIGDLMERDVVSVQVTDDQEDVAAKVARYNFVMIPVVDAEHRMLGIVTHDDVIDVVQEEAIEDAQLIGAVSPLEDSYLETSLFTLIWKRGIWLTVLFVAALFTAFALNNYDKSLQTWSWLAMFIPLVISSGGNSGSQSATLIIAALSAGHISRSDWLRIARRELAQGLLLGGFLATIGYIAAVMLLDIHFAEYAQPSHTNVYVAALVIPSTLLLVVICGTLSGALLPLLFHRLGLDPAMMSTPFVAGIIDIVGIVIYMNVAIRILSTAMN